MAETSSLLNCRTGYSVPRVRISSSPHSIAAQRVSAGLFWYTTDVSSLTDGVCQNRPNDRRSWAAIRLQGPLREERDSASGPQAAQRNLVLDPGRDYFSILRPSLRSGRWLHCFDLQASLTDVPPRRLMPPSALHASKPTHVEDEIPFHQKNIRVQKRILAHE